MRVHFFAIAVMILLTASASAQTVSPPAAPPAPYKYPIVKYLDAKGKPATGFKLKITTNADCKLRINGESRGELKKGDTLSAILSKGRTRIEAICTAYKTNMFLGAFSVIDTGMQTFFDVTFRAKEDTTRDASTPVIEEVSGETVSSGNSKVYTVVEQMPEYEGGAAEMGKFIQANLVYPKAEMDKKIEGKPVVKFTVNEDGTVSDVTILKSVSPGLDQEAVRVAYLLHFRPGRQGGRAVRVSYSLPFSFR
jgi:TonB family protein